MRVLCNLRIPSQTPRRAKILVMYWNRSCGGLVRSGVGRTAVSFRIEGCVNRRDASGIVVFDRSVGDRGKVLSRDQAIAENPVKEAGVAWLGLVQGLASNEMVSWKSGIIFGVEGGSAIGEREMFLESVNSCG
jgi:hypothetical protein